MVKLCQNKWIACIVGVLLFLALVRYKGFDSDAALYLLQVVNYLYPERFLNDVPFMFGNQDTFSIFSPIVALVFKAFGVNKGGFVFTLVMLIAWSGFAAFFIAKWAKRFNLDKWMTFLVPVYFILLLNKLYGSGNLYLPVMESYLVARVFAGVFVFAGLACMFCKNKFISLILFVFATLMHPLMGGWSLPLWLFFHFPRMRLPVIVLSLLSPLSGFAHVGRLDFYPLDWRPMYYTPGLNELISYFGLLAFWLFMYRRIGEPLLSKFAISLFCVSLIGFYLQFVGSYSAHMLFYQAQPFRVQWLCFVSIIPVYVVYVYEIFTRNKECTTIDYVGLLLGMCVIAEQTWYFLLFGSVFFVSRTIRHNFKLNQVYINVFFVVCFVFLLVCSALENTVHLSLEQGIGNISNAVAWFAIPQKLAYVEKGLLVLLSFVCVRQKRFWLAFAFVLSFCNESLKILPMVAILLYLVPHMDQLIKKILISLSVVISFAELLAGLEEFNAIQSAPLQGDPVKSIILFVVLFLLSLWIQITKDVSRKKIALAPFVMLVVLLVWWNVCKWDSRADGQIACERQMDAFFETPIFPQAVDRGKILFAVENEGPIQSRINFLTGAYADASIYVGEIFFRDQFLESNRRRSALLRGDSVLEDMSSFETEILKVYQNPDTLLSRVDFLCTAGEITYFVSDFGGYPLMKQDAFFLDERKMSVYLYKCPIR